MFLSALDLRYARAPYFTANSQLGQCREACSGQAGYSRPVRRSEAKEGHALQKHCG